MIRTVGDLIAALQEYPAGMTVLTPGSWMGLCLVELKRETVVTGPKSDETQTGSGPV